MKATAQAGLKRDYRRNLEIGFIAALVAVLAGFLLFPRHRPPPRSGALESVVFFFPDAQAETPQPLETASVPRVTAELVLEEVREVETPFEIPRPSEAAAAPPPLPSEKGEPREDYDFPPRPRNIIRPDYPEAARLAELEGTVLLRVVVTRDGLVEDAWILEAEIPAFGESALKAVRYWTFAPAVRAGKPVRASVILPIEFVLTEADRT
jgi:protein TonB